MEDKKSVRYFMIEMTQKEFEELYDKELYEAIRKSWTPNEIKRTCAKIPDYECSPEEKASYMKINLKLYNDVVDAWYDGAIKRIIDIENKDENTLK